MHHCYVYGYMIGNIIYGVNPLIRDRQTLLIHFSSILNTIKYIIIFVDNCCNCPVFTKFP